MKIEAQAFVVSTKQWQNDAYPDGLVREVELAMVGLTEPGRPTSIVLRPGLADYQALQAAARERTPLRVTIEKG